MTKTNKVIVKKTSDNSLLGVKDYQSKEYIESYLEFISNLITRIDNDDISLKKAAEINNTIGKANIVIRNKIADEQLKLNREIFESSNKNSLTLTHNKSTK